jgi:large subunit ribosomal protein L9
VLQERAARIRAEFKTLADELSALSLTIKAKAGEEEKLFGSVTNMDIAEALKEAGQEIDKKKIVLDEPIKRLGEYTVEVKIDAEISAKVKVNVIAE